jgi:hypothetical protein
MVLVYTGGWFGASQAWLTPMIWGYFTLTTVVTAWFVYRHYQEDRGRFVMGDLSR